MSICTDIKELEKREAKGIQIHLCSEDSIKTVTGNCKEVIIGDKTLAGLSGLKQSWIDFFNPILNSELIARARRAKKETEFVLEFENPAKLAEFMQLYNRDPTKALEDYSEYIIYVNPVLIEQYLQGQNNPPL